MYIVQLPGPVNNFKLMMWQKVHSGECIETILCEIFSHPGVDGVASVNGKEGNCPLKHENQMYFFTAICKMVERFQF
jgi:hypothetical protein